jgi:hypothetical protein
MTEGMAQGPHPCRRAIALSAALATLAIAGPAAGWQRASSAGAPVEVVSVAGCVREQPSGTWLLVNASDPVPSPDGPVRIEPGTLPTLGGNRFRLIGVGSFRLPSRRDHTVVVQGMLTGPPEARRLNVTSVQTVTATCAAKRTPSPNRRERMKSERSEKRLTPPPGLPIL